MFRNFLAVAVRSFLRQRLYSIINVTGLASGLGCALFIFLWVRDEVSKDQFHPDVDRIFHVVSNLELTPGEIVTWTITPGPLGDEVRTSIPGVELAVRTMDNGAHLFQYEDKNFLERGFYADSGFFEIFDFKITQGSFVPSLRDKSSMAISEKLALNLFGDEDPIGKAVRVNDRYDLEVKAVFEDVSNQSSIKFDFILPFELYREQRGDGFNWGNYDHPLFIRLADRSKAEETIGLINDLRNKLADNTKFGPVTFYMQPFSDRYLHANFENGVPTGGRIKYVQIFSLVAVFIVIIACINFMNMATARAMARAKEVGVRKVVGAQRYSLVIQFLGESLLISFISMALALGVVYLGLPVFNTIVSKEITIDFTNSGFLLSVVGIVFLTGLLAGSYPAFFLSSYQPATVLKGSKANAFGGSSLRQALVVFQFSLTVILVASALIIYDQVEFIRNKNVGYERKAVLAFSARGEVSKSFDAFRNDALQIPGVLNLSKSSSTLVQVNNQNGSVTWDGKPSDTSPLFRTVSVDYDFLETMGLNLEEGRFFSREFNDTFNCVVTRRAVEVMGMKDPVGQRINQWGNEGKIVGVVSDFHSRSMHEPIDPVVFLLNPAWTGRIFVRFDASQTSAVIENLTALYKKYTPEYPFAYTFLDDDFEKLYNNEKVTGSLAYGFTTMAIIISALGLLGLAAFTAERRKKEISIRKTLGASVSGIVTNMSGDFIKLSLVATIVGCPIGYWLMSKFLDSFAYHTDLGWQVFFVTGFLVAIISLLTVIFQVTRAALANPVEALRNE